MTDLQIDIHSTALVLIDLQRGIVSRQTAPHSSADVVARAVRLADRFRKGGGQACSSTSSSQPMIATV